MAKLDIIATLDIGTSKVACVIAEHSPKGDLTIIGSAITSCSGLSKGTIIDPAQTVEAIEKAVSQAEKEAGLNISQVYCNLSSDNLHSFHGHGSCPVISEDECVHEDDIRRVVSASKLIGIPSHHEIVYVAPRDFSLDGQEGIVNPLGLSGLKLEVQSHLVIAAKAYLQNLGRCLEHADLDFGEEQLIPSFIASASATLHDEEKELGVLCLDIGSGTMDLGFYYQGEIFHSAVLPYAGDLLTRDIASHFNIPTKEAEQLKIKHGNINPDFLNEEENQESTSVPSLSGEEEVEISHLKLGQILQTRLLDLTEWVQKQTQDLDATYSSIVLTGGSSRILGIDKFFHKELNKPCRVALPSYPSQLPQQLQSPHYSTALGLLACAHQHQVSQWSNNAETDQNWITRSLHSFKHWIGEIYS